MIIGWDGNLSSGDMPQPIVLWRDATGHEFSTQIHVDRHGDGTAIDPPVLDDDDVDRIIEKGVEAYWLALGGQKSWRASPAPDWASFEELACVADTGDRRSRGIALADLIARSNVAHLAALDPLRTTLEKLNLRAVYALTTPRPAEISLDEWREILALLPQLERLRELLRTVVDALWHSAGGRRPPAGTISRNKTAQVFIEERVFIRLLADCLELEKADIARELHNRRGSPGSEQSLHAAEQQVSNLTCRTRGQRSLRYRTLGRHAVFGERHRRRCGR